MKTNNIPSSIPLKCSKKEKEAILAWIKDRPHHALDECVNSLSRWEYNISDNGLCSDIGITDTATGESFEVPSNSDNW